MEAVLTEKEIIDQIHKEFYTASDEALIEAKEYLASLDNNEKLGTLHSLGFVNAKGVKDHVETNTKADSIRTMSQIITKMSQSYPFYKFITAENVNKICKKYNLACAPVDRYLGDVPHKNVVEIEKFTSNYSYHTAFERVTDITYQYGSLDSTAIRRFKTWLKTQKTVTEQEAHTKFRDLGGTRGGINCKVEKKMMNETLHICAPKKDLNLKGLSKAGSIFSMAQIFKINEVTIPDPVVLCQIPEGYLIITAWGNEASDPLVVNEKMN